MFDDRPSRPAAPALAAARSRHFPAIAVLFLLLTALSLALAGARGLAYLAAFGLATLPGWPVGFALFGRRHAAGWIAGALLGYGLTAAALWVPMALGPANAWTLGASWTVATTLAWGVAGRRRTPAVELPRWTPRDTAALCLVLAMVPALVAAPFLRVGSRDQDGYRQYRAYFTADFLWHVALTQELQHLTLPPVDPYASPQPLHYYWAYFLFPASSTGLLPGPVVPSVERALQLNALAAGVLFVGMVYLFAWASTPKAWSAATAVLLALIAASAEGVHAVMTLRARGQPLAALADLNIDAITLWFLGGLTIDGLPRSLWYTPQHAMACSLGLVALLVAARHGGRARPAALVGIGVALALAVAVSPFLGGAFALVYGVAASLDLAASPGRRVTCLLLQAIPAGLVLLAVGLAWASGMLEGAGGALVLGFKGNARHAPVATIALALGPLLLPAALALPFAWHRGSSRLAAASALAIGLGLFFFVSLARTDPVWIGWRAGQIMLVTLPALAASTFAWLADRRWGRRLLAPAAALLFAVGLPTTLIDLHNAQDVSNRRMGPGFPWTVTLSPAEQQAFAWIRRATPRDAIVQMEMTSRGRATWTNGPTFAGRRMAAGLPISLVAQPYYAERSGRVRQIYAGAEAEPAWQAARGLDIDYLWVGETERQAFPEPSIAKFDDRPDLFVPVFRNDEVRIYAVFRPRASL